MNRIVFLYLFIWYGCNPIVAQQDTLINAFPHMDSVSLQHYMDFADAVGMKENQKALPHAEYLMEHFEYVSQFDIMFSFGVNGRQMYKHLVKEVTDSTKWCHYENRYFELLDWEMKYRKDPEYLCHLRSQSWIWAKCNKWKVSYYESFFRKDSGHVGHNISRTFLINYAHVVAQRYAAGELERERLLTCAANIQATLDKKRKAHKENVERLEKIERACVKIDALLKPYLGE